MTQKEKTEVALATIKFAANKLKVAYEKQKRPDISFALDELVFEIEQKLQRG